ncbi:DUF305 domain-containing protein [Gordonia alkaliphila]|uniref:DUF305 domain-containing protein n=1 Tax=Gordonia alkaliphila TaxID=1053547 RepID=UPI001FF34211|nr:DUF305 domain-containing protein [Gordonia alkaliphila]MCK0439365.1 DUF305 domain-containing protein [Gordonia alkaliphila]
MNIRRYSVAAASTAGVAAVLLLAGCSSDDSTADGQHHGGAASSAATTGSAQNSQVNDADKMFAEMMIPHHEQAVEMSDIMLAKTDIDPRVTELARQIKAAQGPEIETMQGWLKEWGVSDDSAGDHDMGTHDMSGDHDMSEMDGMLSADQMQALKDATGVEASRLFLEGMIEHHEGAVDMANDELKDGVNPDAKALAQQVITTQNAEIETMRGLLTSLQ